VDMLEKENNSSMVESNKCMLAAVVIAR